jgi:TRAP-type C4-dicarboxylate transport system permease large subunit
MMSRFLLVAGFVPKLNDFAIQLGVTPYTFLSLIIILYLLLGMFMEALSMLVVTVPILFPIATSIGINPIWFGVIVVKLAEIAVITPPVGINLYAVIGASGGRVGSQSIFIGVLPFVAIDLIVLGLLVIFPELSLWLPQSIRN